MNKPLRPREKPFRLEEATIDELHAAIRAGEATCVGIVRHYLDARARIQWHLQSVGHEGRCSNFRRERRVARRRAAAFSRGNCASVGRAAGSRQIQRAAARIRPHGGNCLGSGGHAAVRHDRRQAGRRPGKRAGDPQHSRRALRHLPWRFRPASVARAAAERSAAGLRVFSSIARRARASGRA